jgi:uncharacterized protein (DUF433 family)
VTISIVAGSLAGGLPVEEVVGEYPQLTREDVLAAVACSAVR